MAFVRLGRLPIWLVLLLALLPSLATTQDVQPVPALTARVIDQTGTLQPAEQQALEEQLAALERETGAQVAVLMVPTTQPEDIFSYANRVANDWKIGRREVGDGVLLVIAKNDRRVRIEVAKTLEGAIPDLRARQIIDESITPNFRRDDYAAGLRSAIESLSKLIRGEALPAPRATSRPAGESAFQGFELAILLLIAVPLGAAALRRAFGRPLGSVVTGGAVGGLAWLLSASLVVAVLAALAALFMALVGGMGAPVGRGVGRHRGWGGVPYAGGWGSRHGGGWGGGGGGGGFSSGGGGDFGGGGASGGW